MQLKRPHATATTKGCAEYTGCFTNTPSSPLVTKASETATQFIALFRATFHSIQPNLLAFEKTHQITLLSAYLQVYPPFRCSATSRYTLSPCNSYTQNSRAIAGRVACFGLCAAETVGSDKQTSPLFEEAIFKTMEKGWKGQTYRYGPQMDPKPRLTVRERPSSNLRDLPISSG